MLAPHDRAKFDFSRQARFKFDATPRGPIKFKATMGGRFNFDLLPNGDIKFKSTPHGCAKFKTLKALKLAWRSFKFIKFIAVFMAAALLLGAANHAPNAQMQSVQARSPQARTMAP